MDPSGKVWTLPQPNRHHNIIKFMIDSDYGDRVGSECIQGFIDHTSAFIGRAVAAQHALSSGQIKALISPPNLYSEDLW